MSGNAINDAALNVDAVSGFEAQGPTDCVSADLMNMIMVPLAQSHSQVYEDANMASNKQLTLPATRVQSSWRSYLNIESRDCSGMLLKSRIDKFGF